MFIVEDLENTKQTSGLKSYHLKITLRCYIVCVYVLGWPKTSFGFFHNTLWKPKQAFWPTQYIWNGWHRKKYQRMSLERLGWVEVDIVGVHLGHCKNFSFYFKGHDWATELKVPMMLLSQKEMIWLRFKSFILAGVWGMCYKGAMV